MQVYIPDNLLVDRKYTNYNAIIIDKFQKVTICIVVIYNILGKKAAKLGAENY